MSVPWHLRVAAAVRRGRRPTTPRPALPPAKAADAGPDESLAIGMPAKTATPVRVAVNDFIGKSMHVVGATGSGKTAFAMSLVRQLISAGYLVILLDAKGDLREHAIEMLAAHARRDEERLAGNVRTIDFFSDRYLPPFNVLRRDASVAIDLQAYETANLVTETVDAETGIRQSRLAHNLFALLIETGCKIEDACRAVVDEDFLRQLTARCANARVKLYFQAEYAKESVVTRSGVIARIDALLRLPSWRAMMRCDDTIDFDAMLRSGVTVISVANPPLGCQDLQEFAGKLIFPRLARAVMRRPVLEKVPPVAIMIDEPQVFLSPAVAGEMERLITLARSRRVGLHLFHQQVAQLDAVSSSLTKILGANVGFKAVFRTPIEDAQHFAHILPVTGTVLRPDYRPAARSNRAPYLTAAEERRRLVEAIPNLPARSFWFWQAGAGPARLLRTLDVPFDDYHTAARDDPELRDRITQGSIAIPVADMPPDRFDDSTATTMTANPIADNDNTPGAKTLSPLLTGFEELG